MSHPKSALVTVLAAVGVAFTSSCAGGGGGNVEDIGMGSIEMQIWNRSDETVAVFARWGNAPRVRIGQLSGNRRGTYVTAVRGPNVGISWDVVSATPPSGTAPAGAAFPQVADTPGTPQCIVNVDAGDRVEWTIAINAGSCSYVRLDPAE